MKGKHGHHEENRIERQKDICWKVQKGKCHGVDIYWEGTAFNQKEPENKEERGL